MQQSVQELTPLRHPPLKHAPVRVQKPQKEVGGWLGGFGLRITSLPVPVMNDSFN